ncbi:MAG: hypothetical protein IRZ14_19470, partial [Chloroflexi bacterium]|nr:hypothetical protein [Chloroflexota bacterium]
MRNVVPVALLLGLVLVGGTVRAAASAVPPSDAPNRSPGPALGPPALVTRELPATIRPVPTVPLLPSLIPAPSPALF